MLFFVLKGNYRYSFGGGGGKERNEIPVQCMCTTIRGIQADLFSSVTTHKNLTAVVVAAFSGSSQKFHHWHKTHRQGRAGVGTAGLLSLLYSLQRYLDVVQWTRIILIKQKQHNFLKDGNAIFSYTISFSVTKEKWFIFKLFPRFISENLPNQRRKYQKSER